VRGSYHGTVGAVLFESVTHADESLVKNPVVEPRSEGYHLKRSINPRQRVFMRLSNWILLPALALVAGGCVTAHYRYSIAVPGADEASPATVELRWKGGSQTFTVKSDECMQTRIAEDMQPTGCVFADIPRGLDVRVTRAGCKPWEHYYQYVDEDFRSNKWDAFQRWDVIQLAPADSSASSKMIDGTPIYR
jgi:hypothetical protein